MSNYSPLLLVVVGLRVGFGLGLRGLGAATLICAALLLGSYSSPELSLGTGEAARFFLDFLWPRSAIDVGVGVTWKVIVSSLYPGMQLKDTGWDKLRRQKSFKKCHDRLSPKKKGGFKTYCNKIIPEIEKIQCKTSNGKNLHLSNSPCPDVK